ncbi:retron Ec48 family effector membrane protein [Leclercia sp. Marseille-Q4284]|uniref:retron Ec48 family effector membrane protein n=1 Tax=Leclercia sp. Marseille-Q4284 TaxID=2866582 RepID=UPI001CE41C77|nr:retron Ec48 family effector membrane protein [Leclercia sp. Marseille-Q4284]
MKIKSILASSFSFTLLTLIIIAFISLIVLAVISFLDIISNRDLVICLTEKCIVSAGKIFETPISILKQSLIFIPVFVFFIGLYNYQLAIKNTKNNNMLNKERDFYSYLKEHHNEEEHLIEALNKKKLFNSLFDDELKFNTKAKEKIESYFKLKNSQGKINLLPEEKKEKYKDSILVIAITFGFKVDDEIELERMDEVINSICFLMIEIIEVWFGIIIEENETN